MLWNLRSRSKRAQQTATQYKYNTQMKVLARDQSVDTAQWTQLNSELRQIRLAVQDNTYNWPICHSEIG
jgi:hypothetical protein